MTCHIAIKQCINAFSLMNLFQRDYPTDKRGTILQTNFVLSIFLVTISHPGYLLVALYKLIARPYFWKTNQNIFFKKKKSLSYLIEHRQVELVPNWGLRLYQLVFMILESPLQRRKETARTAVNPVSYNDDMPA